MEALFRKLWNKLFISNVFIINTWWLYLHQPPGKGLSAKHHGLGITVQGMYHSPTLSVEEIWSAKALVVCLRVKILHRLYFYCNPLCLFQSILYEKLHGLQAGSLHLLQTLQEEVNFRLGQENKVSLTAGRPACACNVIVSWCFN